MKAFPHKVMSAEQGQGMDLRDYFAAKAMQAFIQRGHCTPNEVPPFAYLIADEMMKAR